VTQPPSADVVPSGAIAAQYAEDPAQAPRIRRVAPHLPPHSRFIVLIAIPAVLALALTGIWLTGTARSAGAYGQVGRLATLGQQVTGLAQAMAGERSATATFISGGRPGAGLAALHRQYAITDARAAWVRRLVSQLGNGYPAQTRAGAAQVLASIGRLPGLRGQAVKGQASALAVMNGYSAAISGLFPVTDGIADLSGNSTLITSVRALGSLSRLIEDASQQQAVLDVALAEGRFAPGMLSALTAAQAQQASDLASFRNSATPEESGALAVVLARPVARRAQAVEQQAIAAGQAGPGRATPPKGALALGPQASHQWSAGMSGTVGWMSQAQQQLAGWIAADAQSLQRNTMRSAMVTGAAALGVLALVLLGGIFAARSWLRRRRRLEAAELEQAALEGPGARLAIGASDVSAGFSWRNHALLERLLQQIDSMELNEDDPERLASLFEMDHLATRIWRNSDSALVLAGHEPPRPVRPLALVDVLRAAASEIEEYSRVILDVQQGVRVSGSAATDTVHLVAELLENATTFSPRTTQVIVSGHAVVGGGSLITITDGGPGMSEEELALFNWQLDNPAPADMAVARRMGLFAVALLAARHGITVTLSKPPDGGTTAEVYLPAALISLGAAPSGWHGRSGEASLTIAGEEASAAAADPSFSAHRFAAGPEPHPGMETGGPEAVPAMLGAPVASPAPAASTAGTEPDPVDPEPGDGPPIFESVRSGYLHAFGRDLPRSGEQQAAQPPAGRPAGPPAAWGHDNGRTGAGAPAAGAPAAGAPAAGAPASSRLPQRGPQPGQVRGEAAAQETQQVPATDSAETTRNKLASFQNGSRRARAVARANRSAKQPGQDG
jgi:signal transduction histidine kinase